MEYQIIELSINIQASMHAVWRVFTDPAATKQMGGFYETNWKAGNSFAFVKTDGTKLTNGRLLELQPGKLIKHSLFKTGSEEIISVITYEFFDNNGYTLLKGKEELSQPLGKAAFDDAREGWEFALQSVKEIAEKI